jgi:proteasome lid subunit RPN8/RPN11
MTTSMLLMSPKLCLQIHAHAVSTFPEECCGVMLGLRENSVLRIHAAIPTPNTAPVESRASRYVIDPRDILRADKIAQAGRLDIIGFYHSHPNHPAVPSKTDLSLSWPDYVYVIAAIAAEGPQELRAWQLPGRNQPMQEVRLHVSDSIPFMGDIA